jgi:hypothetical protein
MAPCATQTVRKSVSGGTSATTLPAITGKTDSTFVPSAAAPTTPSPGLAAQSTPTSEGLLHFFSHSTKVLSYTDFSSSIVPRIFNSDLHSNSHVFSKIISPYSAAAFNFFLCKHNILYLYLSLTRNLVSGFPIGFMPEITKTTIIPNHPSCIPFMDDVYNYLSDEVRDGRMSGPFSAAEVESTLRSPFFSSPLLVSVQPQAPGTPDKIRMCKNLSKGTKTVDSVNYHILKASFPTRFDTASRVANIVSPVLHYFYYYFPLHLASIYTPYLYQYLYSLFAILYTPYSICDSEI